ncbi:hypothetical protein FJT64_018026 [Amphibalanus amphitrite]|uniref:Uncharacterized protein n=1 Tax=Amphibalanus amphitrite TaxID=1232801 RepID=A0A6A4WYW0_AMPAM|nr:hypothetical protein FJT64_018026 [Amphibalanus amphitrite]
MPQSRNFGIIVFASLSHLLTAAHSVTYPPYSRPSRAGEVRLQLRCQTIQWNEQQPMYPSRLCRCVSQLERRRPTAALLYNCHVHTRCTVTADQAVLVSAAADGQPAQEHQVASLSSAWVYWKALLAPALWAGSAPGQQLSGPAPPPLPQPPEPPPPPPAEDRASSRSGTPAAAAVSRTPPAPPAAPTLAWLPALERLEVCLQISAVTVTVPAGPESGGGAAGDAERTADPLPAAAGHHPAPVPGRVRSSSDSGHRYCLHGQLVSVLPSVRLDSAALKSAALPTVPEVPVRLTRPSAAAAGSQLRSPSQTQQVMSPSVVVRDCAPIPPVAATICTLIGLALTLYGSVFHYHYTGVGAPPAGSDSERRLRHQSEVRLYRALLAAGVPLLCLEAGNLTTCYPSRPSQLLSQEEDRLVSQSLDEVAGLDDTDAMLDSGPRPIIRPAQRAT